MAPTSTPRIIKTEEEKAYLRAKIKDGMTGAHAKDKVEEAMKETGFTRENILQFVRNEKTKDYRGKKKSKADPEMMTLYGGLLCNNEEEFAFNGSGMHLGNLTKAKAKKYQELKKTAHGRKILQENLQKQKEKRMGSQLTDTQKHNRALGCFHRVEKETEVLSTLGFKAAMVCSQPTRRPTVMGDTKAVNFFADNKKLMHGFDHEMTNGNGPLTSKHRQKLLRGRVQSVFNGLYVNEYGLRTGTLPYKDIETGKVILTMQGLPDAVPFKRPSAYTIPEMEEILQCAKDLKICRTTEGKLLVHQHIRTTQHSEPVQESTPQLGGPIPHPAEPSILQISAPTQEGSESPSVQTYEISDDGQVHQVNAPSDNFDSSVVSVPHEPMEVALQRIRNQWKKQQEKDSSQTGEKSQEMEEAGHSASSDVSSSQYIAVSHPSLDNEKRPVDPIKKPPAAATTSHSEATLPQPKRKARKRALKDPTAASTASCSSLALSKPMRKVKKHGIKNASPITAVPSAEKVDGKRVKQLYVMERQKGRKTSRTWFNGDLTVETGNYIIKFDLLKGEKTRETSILTREEFCEKLKDGVIVLL